MPVVQTGDPPCCRGRQGRFWTCTQGVMARVMVSTCGKPTLLPSSLDCYQLGENSQAPVSRNRPGTHRRTSSTAASGVQERDRLANEPGAGAHDPEAPARSNADPGRTREHVGCRASAAEGGPPDPCHGRGQVPTQETGRGLSIQWEGSLSRTSPHPPLMTLIISLSLAPPCSTGVGRAPSPLRSGVPWV